MKPVFDGTQPRRVGSTVPIRLQMLDREGRNLSSPAVPLLERGVTRLATSAAVLQSNAPSHANPDGAFRFDPSLPGYIFNLSTKGLSAGRYVLSFWAGGDRQFSYNVLFELR